MYNLQSKNEQTINPGNLNNHDDSDNPESTHLYAVENQGVFNNPEAQTTLKKNNSELEDENALTDETKLFKKESYYPILFM